MSYHRSGVCEKGFNTDFARKLNGRKVNSVISQLDRCIKERKYVMDNFFNGGDEPHKNQIKILSNFKKKLVNIKSKYTNNPNIYIKYNKTTRFKAFIKNKTRKRNINKII